MINGDQRIYSVSVELCTAFLLATASAHGVASFARQTGLACSSCHTTLPELTPLGRIFKLNGYTMTGIQQITSDRGPTKAGLNINTWLPLSAFFQLSNTTTNKPQPTTQNGSFEFPQAVSLFLAGAFSTHAGGFMQVTYNTQANHFAWDNTDLRYANRAKVKGKEVIYGITFNNNPTVEDLWHSTPAWGFPWVSADAAPRPAASTIIAGPLAQDVAGVGAYGMWDNHLYGNFAVYRSEHLGGPQPSSGSGFGFNLRGVAPYWRLAWQQTVGNNYLEVGGYGMHMNSSPNAVVGPTDVYTDTAADLQYERTLPWESRNDLLTVHGTYIHERSNLNAGFAGGSVGLPGHRLNTWRGDAIYHVGNKYSGTLGWFDTGGSADSVLYAPAPVSGSASGRPKTDGYIANFSYWPVQNIQLTAQYTGYFKFNGGGTNYDGSGRKASDNNTIYLMVWFIF